MPDTLARPDSLPAPVEGAAVAAHPLPDHPAAHHLPRAREDALAAMEHAAQWLAIEPSALSADAYRAFREADSRAHMPSPLAISILFGGWERAREHAAALSRDNAVVEAEVIRAIYGDPTADTAPTGPRHFPGR